jgi:hypothetical protein
MELEDLYDLIDEMINVDMAEDAEIGMRVRIWHQKYNNPNNDDFDFEDLTEDEEWSEFMVGEWDDDEE